MEVPPGASVIHSTVCTAGFVIISVFCAKRHVIMPSQRISCCPWIWTHFKSILRMLITNAKPAIFGIHSNSVPVLHVHSQRTGSRGRQPVDLVISQPELSRQLTKAWFVIVPAPIEVHRSILSSLKHCPSSSVSAHVTVHGEGSFSVWVYRVHSTLCMAWF